MAVTTTRRDRERPELSRREVVALGSAAVVSTVLPMPTSVAKPETFPEFVPIPWLPGITYRPLWSYVVRCHGAYWNGAKEYSETGDAALLQKARDECLRLIGGVLAVPPDTGADVRLQQIGRDLLGKALIEYAELPWERDYRTHYGYRNYRNWPRRVWLQEGHASRPVLLEAGYAA